MNDLAAAIFIFTAVLVVLIAIGAPLLLARRLSPRFDAWCAEKERWL